MFLYLIIPALVLGYWLMKTVFVRRLQRTNKIGNYTLVLFSFIAGVAIGSGNFTPIVWIPLTLAMIFYYWPRLKAFFLTGS